MSERQLGDRVYRWELFCWPPPDWCPDYPYSDRYGVRGRLTYPAMQTLPEMERWVESAVELNPGWRFHMEVHGHHSFEGYGAR